MNNRVYYGEYTLEYWIDQMLSGTLELPPYQRSFVWTKHQVTDLIQAMKSHFYITPVTIGRIDGKNHGIDGQRRLTSLLLAYFEVLPAKKNIEPPKCRLRKRMMEKNQKMAKLSNISSQPLRSLFTLKSRKYSLFHALYGRCQG